MPAVVAVAVVMLTACTTSWLSGGFDATQTNNNASDNTITAMNVGTLSQRWTVDAGSNHQPLVSDDVVYLVVSNTNAAGTGGYGVRAVANQTGTTLWQFEADPVNVQPGGMAVSGHLLYIVGPSGLFALDAATGALRWSAPGHHQLARPLVVGSNLYVGDRAYDAVTGALRWTAPNADSTVLTIDGGVALAAALPPVACADIATSYPSGIPLVALDAGTGTLRWTAHLAAGWIAWAAMSVGGRFIVTTGACGVNAVKTITFDVTTGAPEWTSDRSFGAAGQGRLFGVTDGVLDDAMGASDPATGVRIPTWQFVNSCGYGYDAPVVSGSILFSEGHYQLCAIDAPTGTLLHTWATWRNDLGANVSLTGALSAANGCVYLGTSMSGAPNRPFTTKMCIDGAGS